MKYLKGFQSLLVPDMHEKLILGKNSNFFGQNGAKNG